MTHAIVQAARIEEQRLRAELESHPLFRKLEAVRSLITLYEDVVVQHDAPINADARQMQNRVSSRLPAKGSKTATVGEAAADYLRQVGRRAQSRELAQAVEKAGVVLSGKNPIGGVSSALSHNSLFDNVLGQGYGLKEWGGGSGPKAKPPNGFFDGSRLSSTQDAEAEAGFAHAEQPAPPATDDLSAPQASDHG